MVLNSSSKLVRYSICHRAIGEANKNAVRDCVLQWRWVSSSAIGRETKRRENDLIILVRAFRFHVWVRLKDDYKRECG